MKLTKAVFMNNTWEAGERWMVNADDIVSAKPYNTSHPNGPNSMVSIRGFTSGIPMMETVEQVDELRWDEFAAKSTIQAQAYVAEMRRYDAEIAPIAIKASSTVATTAA